jgi:hypothetical protein
VSPTERTPAGGGPADLGLTEEDHSLLAELSTVLDLVDPVPDDLVERTQFALDLEHLDVEVARWETASRLAGVRSHAAPSTITFAVEDLTVMISLAPALNGNRFDGWLVPGGPHRIEVRVEGHESSTTNTDEDGRFVLSDVPRGFTQILVHFGPENGQPAHAARTVVTPTIVL